jgi:O-antigen ligase
MRLPLPPSELPLLAFTAVMPAVSLGLYTGSNHDAARLAQLGAVLLTAALSASGLARTNSATRPGAAQGWLIAALALASIATASVPIMAAREAMLMFGLAGTAWVVANRFSVTSLAPARLAVVLGSSLYALVLALLALSPLVHRAALDWASLVVGYDNYRFFNHVQTVALPLLAIIANQPGAGRTGRWMGTATWFSMIVYWAFVFCSGARGTALAIAVAVLGALPLVGWRATVPVVRTLAISAIGGAATYAVIFLLLPAMGLLPVGASAERSLPSLASDSSRLLLWRISWNEIAASPWLGIGPMHYAHFPNPKAAHPHNIYLQVAAEWGIPMLLALLALTGRALWRLARTIRGVPGGPERAEGSGLLIACLAFLADGLVSGNFVMPVAQMWMVLCAAWAIAWTRLHRSAPSTTVTASVAWPRLAVLALLASQIWLMMAVWPEATHLESHLARVQRDVAHGARPSPRFWSNGWF